MQKKRYKKLRRKKSRIRNKAYSNNSFDKGLLTLSIVLTVLGVIAIADVSAPQALAVFSDSFYFAKQQIVWGGIGFIALIIGALIHYSFWRKVALVLFGLSIVLLILVLIPPFGARLLGARRWINLGPISFQPAEFVKLSLAIYLSSVGSTKPKLIPFLIPILIATGLIMMQPDFGTAVILAGIGATIMFVSGVNLFKLLLVSFGAALFVAPLVWFSDYRKARLMTFIGQSNDPLGSSYHIRQILLALGSGGLFGVGLGQSRQKYLFLPETATDSVFPILAEEIGFVGSVVIIFLLVVFILRIVKIASLSKDVFASTLSAGIVGWIGGQFFLNLGSMVALVPLTGIPLPFFSYGGSSLTMILFATGILLNISKNATMTKE